MTSVVFYCVFQVDDILRTWNESTPIGLKRARDAMRQREKYMSTIRQRQGGAAPANDGSGKQRLDSRDSK